MEKTKFKKYIKTEDDMWEKGKDSIIEIEEV